MKNKNFILSTSCLISLLMMTGCSAGSSSLSASSETSSSSSLVLPEEDKVKPTSTSLEYTDYAESGDGSYNESKWYRNDLKDKNLPDPFVLNNGDGTYYLFGTTDRTGAMCFDCYSTTDFINFELHTNVYTPSSNGWAKSAFFAPEVYKFGDTYYLYYSASNSSGRRYLNIATSDSPTGPYQDYVGNDADGNAVNYLTTPFLTENNNEYKTELGPLDQTLLVDGDDIYLYYSIYDDQITKSQYIVGMKMKDPVTVDYDTYTKLIVPGVATPDTTQLEPNEIYRWEIYTSNLKVCEGPCVIKSPVNGKYYITYSVNHYDNVYYSVCYAEADSPLGNYVKPYTKGQLWTNLLFGYGGGMKGTTVYNQWAGFMAGTGHHSIFKVGDEYMIVYHAYTNRGSSDFNGRRVAFDHVYFNKTTGVPYTHGPSYSLEPLPAEVSGYQNIALNATVLTENVTNPENINDNYIVEHYNLKQEADKEVTLNKGTSYIELQFDKEYSVGGLSIYNSAFYDKYQSDISFINFFNGNAIMDTAFPTRYLNDEKSFIYPDSAFTYDFDDIKATKVIIGFNNPDAAKAINEIAVFGY
ncbi:MAG: family 43 glycosylhydrolase [Bacilli bacterium]